MNTKAIADAIAARFSALTATNAGETKGLAIGPTASLPNAIGKGPALLVYHPTGTLDLGPNRRRDDHLEFPVRLLVDPLNYPERSDWLYAWYDAVRDKVEAKMQLGLDYVAWAKVTRARVELDGEPYAGSTYDVVELTVEVKVYEVVATVAV